MFDEHPSRRLLLKSALAVGSVGALLTRLAVAAPTPECREDDEPTESNIEGPFFKPRSPMRADLVVPNTNVQIYQLEGRVLTRSCKPVPGALLDLWHANAGGDYDNSGFTYRGHIFADAQGRYRFRTILPGPYPGRTRHYHLKVQAPRGRVLTTQLYFPADARANDYDCFYLPELLMRVTPAKANAPAVAQFDFVLNIA